jgi:hypothetical protein
MANSSTTARSEHTAMSDTMKDPAAAAKQRQRGLSVLERQAGRRPSASRRRRRRHGGRAGQRSAASRLRAPGQSDTNKKTSMAARRLEAAVGSA